MKLTLKQADGTLVDLSDIAEIVLVAPPDPAPPPPIDPPPPAPAPEPPPPAPAPEPPPPPPAPAPEPAPAPPPPPPPAPAPPPPPPPAPAPPPAAVFSPEITGEQQIDPADQFAVYDGGSVTTAAPAGGPSWLYWSERLGLKWKHPNTGDWTDRDGVEQGPTPFVTSLALVAGAYVELDVSNAVALDLQPGQNKGLRIISNAAGWVWISGRTSANPPRAVVVTDEGAFECPCLANASYYPRGTTAVSVDSRAQVHLSNGWSSIFRFDYSAVRGNFRSAKVQLFIESAGGTGPKVMVLRCSPPGPLQVGCGDMAPVLGLAAEVGEAALRSHPDVYAAGDFEGATYDATLGRAFVPKIFGRVNCHPANTPEFVRGEDGGVWWRGSFAPLAADMTNLGTAPERGSFDGSFELMHADLTDPLRPPANVVEELWYRMYLFLEDDYNTTLDGSKMGVTLDLRMGYYTDTGYWQATTGNGGLRGDGKRHLSTIAGKARYDYHGHMLRQENGFLGRPDDRLAAVRTLVGYNYHVDQLGPFPGGQDDPLGGPAYNDVIPVVFRTGRAYCIEQHIVMNSIDMTTVDDQGNGVGRHDGLLETEINGVLVSRLSNYRWRHHPQMGICQGNANAYYGGRNWLDHRMHYRLCHFAAAKRRIGPRVAP